MVNAWQDSWQTATDIYTTELPEAFAGCMGSFGRALSFPNCSKVQSVRVDAGTK